MKWNQTGCIIGSPFESTVPSLNGVLEVERKMSHTSYTMSGAFSISLCTLTISSDRLVKTPDRYFFVTRTVGPFRVKTGQIFRLVSYSIVTIHDYQTRYQLGNVKSSCSSRHKTGESRRFYRGPVFLLSSSEFVGQQRLKCSSVLVV